MPVLPGCRQFGERSPPRDLHLLTWDTGSPLGDLPFEQCLEELQRFSRDLQRQAATLLMTKEVYDLMKSAAACLYANVILDVFGGSSPAVPFTRSLQLLWSLRPLPQDYGSSAHSTAQDL